jgi:probable F420-dependent oxidoreductase
MTGELHSGVHLPNYAPWWREPGIQTMARLVEEAGFDSVWLSDHVVLADDVRSRYPFSTDGAFFTDPGTEWLEWLTTAAFLAGVTERVDIGVGVCVLPLRQPMLLAKQVATLDQLSGGRALLGVGAGWLAEEFEALGVDFAARGQAMDGGLRLLRAAWTGEPEPGEYGPWTLPPGVHCQPRPLRGSVPLFVGGDSAAALRRVAAYGTGWYGSAPGGHLAPERVARVRGRIAEQCQRYDRDPAEIEIALRVAVSRHELAGPGLVERLAGYVDAGVTRLSFDIGWRGAETLPDRLAALAGAVEQIRRENR